MGPRVAPGGPGQRNRRNNVPMRTAAFYFLPTTFSWQTRHSHDRGLGSKPRGQRNRHQRNAEVNTSTASGIPRQAPAPSPGHWEALEHGAPRVEPHRGWKHRAAGLPLPVPAPHGPEPLPHSGSAGIGGRAVSLCLTLAPTAAHQPPPEETCMLETPRCPLPAHLTTATGHNTLLPSQCLKR